MECKDEIYSASQLLSVKTEKLCNNASNAPEIVLTAAEEEPRSIISTGTKIDKPVTVTSKFFVPFSAPSPAVSTQARPQTATSKIFAPRTEEMSKGFLTFSEEEPGLTSKYRSCVILGLRQ